ncbi:MAG: hypothetical protein HY675_14070 [Chloroflexi bacterium]|nr:hypothetical protein [Chloroflexota bacterium]
MSEKSAAQKLAIKEGQRFLLVNAPAGYQDLLADLPKDVSVVTEPSGTTDVIQCFVTSKAQLEEVLPRLKANLNRKGIFWVAYPKGTSKIKADINRDIIRGYAQTIGMEAVAIFSIDDDWACLRLKVV